MKKKVYIAFLVVFLLGAGIWYIKARKNIHLQNTGTQTGQQPLKLVISKDLQDVAFIDDFARDKGFYAKNNLSVEDILAEKDFTNVLLSGAGDVVIGSYVGSLSAYFNNADTRGLGNLSYQFRQIGVSRFSKDQSQMIKKVAVQTLAGDPVSVMNSALKNIGVDPASVQMVAVASVEAREAMLANGELDFIILTSQNDLAGLDSNKNFTVYNSEEITKGTNEINEVYTLQDRIDKDPKELQSFMTALYQALQYADNNPAEVKDYFVSKYKLSPENAEAFYNLYVQARKGVALVPTADMINAIGDEVKAAGKISSSRDAAGFLYTDFSKNAEAVK